MNKDLRNVEVMINSGFNGAGMHERMAKMHDAVKFTKANRSKLFVQLMMMVR